MLCVSLPQCISRPNTSFCSTDRVKQALAHKCGPLQRQLPLDQAPLAAAADKGVDHIMPVSRSHSYLNTASGEHTAIVTLLAVSPSTDSEDGHLDPREGLHQCLPLYGGVTVTRLLNTEDSCHIHKWLELH